MRVNAGLCRPNEAVCRPFAGFCRPFAGQMTAFSHKSRINLASFPAWAGSTFLGLPRYAVTALVRSWPPDPSVPPAKDLPLGKSVLPWPNLEIPMQPLIWCFLAYFSPPSALFSRSEAALGLVLSTSVLSPVFSPTLDTRLLTLDLINLLALSPRPNSPSAHQIPRIYARKRREKTCIWTRINLSSPILEVLGRLRPCPLGQSGWRRLLPPLRNRQVPALLRRQMDWYLPAQARERSSQGGNYLLSKTAGESERNAVASPQGVDSTLNAQRPPNH